MSAGSFPAAPFYASEPFNSIIKFQALPILYYQITGRNNWVKIHFMVSQFMFLHSVFTSSSNFGSNA